MFPREGVKCHRTAVPVPHALEKNVEEKNGFLAGVPVRRCVNSQVTVTSRWLVVVSWFADFMFSGSKFISAASRQMSPHCCPCLGFLDEHKTEKCVFGRCVSSQVTVISIWLLVVSWFADFMLSVNIYLCGRT